ncbi:unnamed protein product [Lupinus luteus]|uniref:Uncharacterized protein n=1 Tax=Lupinus luteus TaxID=3873 RepID=A0AAV1VX45_LUPLU
MGYEYGAAKSATSFLFGAWSLLRSCNSYALFGANRSAMELLCLIYEQYATRCLLGDRGVTLAGNKD